LNQFSGDVWLTTKKKTKNGPLPTEIPGRDVKQGSPPLFVAFSSPNPFFQPIFPTDFPNPSGPNSVEGWN
jgi:hypothetical protein